MGGLGQADAVVNGDAIALAHPYHPASGVVLWLERDCQAKPVATVGDQKGFCHALHSQHADQSSLGSTGRHHHHIGKLLGIKT